jgi:hypothetical protein
LSGLKLDENGYAIDCIKGTLKLRPVREREEKEEEEKAWRRQSSQIWRWR